LLNTYPAEAAFDWVVIEPIKPFINRNTAVAFGMMVLKFSVLR